MKKNRWPIWLTASAVALIAFLDAAKDVDVTQAVASYLNDAFPDHVKQLLQ